MRSFFFFFFFVVCVFLVNENVNRVVKLLKFVKKQELKKTQIKKQEQETKRTLTKIHVNFTENENFL